MEAGFIVGVVPLITKNKVLIQQEIKKDDCAWHIAREVSAVLYSTNSRLRADEFVPE